jgi:hypothetical protein
VASAVGAVVGELVDPGHDGGFRCCFSEFLVAELVPLLRGGAGDVQHFVDEEEACISVFRVDEGGPQVAEARERLRGPQRIGDVLAVPLGEVAHGQGPAGLVAGEAPGVTVAADLCAEVLRVDAHAAASLVAGWWKAARMAARCQGSSGGAASTMRSIRCQ